MQVLSLFDGISCGMLALERAGIKVNKYYASEIDEHAIAISKKNHKDIIQMGDVTNWKIWNVDWSKIDYTEGITDRERARTIGNGWTVDVIAHIFKGLKNEGGEK